MPLETTSTATSSPTYNRWQRFVNWLAGGPPDPEKIAAAQKKYPTWYRRYALSILISGGTSLGMIYPFVIERLNATPEVDSFKTVQLRVKHAREGDPHFEMELHDGTIQSMEWPVRVTLSKGVRVYYWTKAQREALKGCLVTAQVAPMRWTLTSRYRVWSLSCPAANLEVSADQTAHYLKKHSTSLTSKLIFFLILVFPLGFVLFLREKRGVL